MAINTNFWKNKKVFLTGHTGFKGSWMSLWLLKMGANVTGYSLPAPTSPSLFEELKISQEMNSIIGDIRDPAKLSQAVVGTNPEIIIHMAAQPLVRYSYQEPVETYMVNVMGTVYLFEAARKLNNLRALVNVTSDKCYENQERKEGYKEFEAMGGYDPYSNSKGCSELVTSAYRRSFFQKQGVPLASGRAGNVIGGGDWALDRLIPDIVRSALQNEKLTIRNPYSVRPWQHVLEPLCGYLTLAEKLYVDGVKFAEGFNFGPAEKDHCDVETIIRIMNTYWDQRIKYEVVSAGTQPHEANLLKLDCTKAESVLGWRPRWGVDQALELTVEWNKQRLAGESVKQICLNQIDKYSVF